MNVLAGFLAQLLHIALMAAAAPTLGGISRWTEMRLAGRHGPSVLLPWYDLQRLLRKQPVIADTASSLSTLAPLAGAAAMAVAVCLVPSFTLGMTLAPFADLLVIAGLLAVARCSLALAAMDAGTALGGMGASRTMLLAGASEPALLIAVFGLGLLAGSLNVDLIATLQQQSGANWQTATILAFAAIVLVALVDAGVLRSEAMALESSGTDLALFEVTAALRLLVWFNLIGTLFLPYGMAHATLGPMAWLTGLAVWLVRTLLFAAIAGSLRAVNGRLRMPRAAQMLGVAALLGLLAAVFWFAGTRIA